MTPPSLPSAASCPDSGEHAVGPDSSTPTEQKRAPWRSLASATALGTPAGIGMLHPMLGEILASGELVAVLTIIGTALFGSADLSDRAFRLLRWIGNRPEPPAPAVATTKRVGAGRRVRVR